MDKTMTELVGVVNKQEKSIICHRAMDTMI